MKTRVTFRVAEELAELLRELPNQTQFVESALRDALGISCPSCGGTGRAAGRLHVQDFRTARLPRLDHATALQLKSVVRLARQVAATDVGLSRSKQPGSLAFEIRRDKNVIMSGAVSAGVMKMAVN